jgi:hypothetical protein
LAATTDTTKTLKGTVDKDEIFKYINEGQVDKITNEIKKGIDVNLV